MTAQIALWFAALFGVVGIAIMIYARLGLFRWGWSMRAFLEVNAAGLMAAAVIIPCVLLAFFLAGC